MTGVSGFIYREIIMKRSLSILLVTALVAPLFFMTGCACNDDSYGKMRDHYGGK